MDTKRTLGLALLCAVVIMASFAISKTYVDVKTESMSAASFTSWWPFSAQPVTRQPATMNAVDAKNNLRGTYAVKKPCPSADEVNAAQDAWHAKETERDNAVRALSQPGAPKPPSPEFTAAMTNIAKLIVETSQLEAKYRELRDLEGNCGGTQSAR